VRLGKKFEGSEQEKLNLLLFVDGKIVFEALVKSGQARAQVYRKAGRNIPGSMEPCPQGHYQVGDIIWYGGKDNYAASGGQGLGPLFIPIYCEQELRRGEFGIHLDTGAPGTAGCLGLQNIEKLKELVAVLRKYDPKDLDVDWGL
jgi:lysozyme